LAAHQVVEFLFELFLVEQLATGRSVDLSAQFRDAILISELLIRLAAYQRPQYVVTKCKVGCGRNRPHRHETTVPTAIQNATGPNLTGLPAWARV
jgi:hypothetical protein